MNTIIEKIKEKGTIAIRPFLNGSKNMGLEKYDMVIHPATKQVETITCIEKNGVKRYITGLDEQAPEILSIKDEKERKAKIRNIRETVAYLEKVLEYNEIDPEDPKFWDKVKRLRPNNSLFWDTFTVTCTNEPLYLNPDDTTQLILIKAIEAGGFQLVAKSYDDAKVMSPPPKFYLDRQIDTVRTKTEGKKLRNKALSLLDELFYKDQTKLFYVAKITDSISHQYKHRTPIDVLYNNMDNYINGQGTELNAIRAAETFIRNASEYDLKTLKLKAIAKDAAFYSLIQTKVNGMYYHVQTDTMLGRNLEEVVAFIDNPVNEDVLFKLTEGVEKMWSN